ncbi:hypothetical protein [Pontibacillus litoralis]|uniref:Uncharacterized protein n=1 Tax=Pontibacillus litoralis JSM 072002 TaxID=1385512 RepID=A0A0A5G2I0_9BACI|nr:hypothetical protein [Pontibacillus litoralis]KGX85295.1 hypothetical protein N784_09650 [Pontibacillus litoralis JSM 072002]
MFICPVCNGLQSLQMQCLNCNQIMNNQGRVADYFDEYSPYLQDEGLKMIDGDSCSSLNHTCVHLLYCFNCGNEQSYAIEENNT